MYSVILAAMLSGGAQQTEAWHVRSGSCYGGCYGSCVGSCYGSCSGCYGSCTGCYGSSCHGWGHGLGLGHGCHGGLFSRWNHGCFGCHGSCYGNGYSYTVGYSYWASGCYGSSCFGGCYGTAGIGCNGWSGGYASASSVPSPVYSDSECHPAQGSGNVIVPSQAVDKVPSRLQDKAPDAPKGDSPKSDLPKLDAPKGVELPKVGGDAKAQGNSAALVVVLIPADAKLWVDTVSCPLPGTMRTFNTPALVPGAQYAYTLVAETPDGLRQERRVTMSAGGVVEVDFRSMGMSTAQR